MRERERVVQFLNVANDDLKYGTHEFADDNLKYGTNEKFVEDKRFFFFKRPDILSIRTAIGCISSKRRQRVMIY